MNYNYGTAKWKKHPKQKYVFKIQSIAMTRNTNSNSTLSVFSLFISNSFEHSSYQLSKVQTVFVTRLHFSILIVEWTRILTMYGFLNNVLLFTLFQFTELVNSKHFKNYRITDWTYLMKSSQYLLSIYVFLDIIQR